MDCFGFWVNMSSLGVRSKSFQSVVQTFVVNIVRFGKFFGELFISHHQPFVEILIVDVVDSSLELDIPYVGQQGREPGSLIECVHKGVEFRFGQGVSDTALSAAVPGDQRAE